MEKKQYLPLPDPLISNSGKRVGSALEFFNFRRVIRTGIDVLKLWYVLVVRRAHHGAPAAARNGSRTGSGQRVL